VNVMNLQVPQKAGHFLTAALSSSGRTLLHVVSSVFISYLMFAVEEA
jgi:hypothetical protein